ncbi:Rv3654c family TadE-like protein [Streptomyces sp. MMBL 11-3]|uniref:Rv3654c family TadE-like protein n=1 Tax=Streptomyces sp. MMBL 11-3 TaxID=3382639 RepID=UPI0039B6CA09
MRARGAVGDPVRKQRPGPAADRGSATIWTVGAIAVLCVVFGAVLVMGQAVVIRHRAGGAADLAALAAADHWTDGRARACARADRVARAQDTRVVRCSVDGDVSDVTVAAGRGPLTAEVRSRAGPANTSFSRLANSGLADSEPADSDSAGSEPTGSGSADSESAGSGSARAPGGTGGG